MDPLFAWKDAFFTDIQSIDQQHQRLVELINDLAASAIDAEQGSFSKIGPAYNQLLDYARIHFADEEQVMVAGGIAESHISAHKEQHQSFIDEVNMTVL